MAKRASSSSPCGETTTSSTSICGRHLPGRQVDGPHRVVLAELLADLLPGAQRCLLLAEHVLGRRLGRRPQADHLQEAGRGALERRLDGRADARLAQLAGRRDQLPLRIARSRVRRLQDQVQVVGLLREERGGNRAQLVGVEQSAAG